MPSLVHQGLLLLLQQSTRLWVWILRHGLGLDVPDEVSFEPGPETIRQLTAADHIADTVVVAARSGQPKREAFIGEVQRSPDPDKRYTWALYVAGLSTRLRCPVTLVVITTSRAVERWSAGTIDLGRGQMTLRPLVLGPSKVPRLVDPDLARQLPELAVLAVAMHGRSPGSKRTIDRAIGAVSTLAEHDEERARFYMLLISIFVGEDVKTMMTEQMKQDVLRRLEEERERRIRKWTADIVRRASLRDALGVMLNERSLQPSPQQQARIEACGDENQLKQWIRRAVSARSVSELFEDS